MKKRLICLLMSILMIVPMFLIASCAEEVIDEEKIKDDASNFAITLTMYLLSPQKVHTADEIADMLEEKGIDDPDYKEAKAIYDAHEAVEAAMNKITKSKYKIQLNVYWYTIDEYYTIIEEKLVGFDGELEMRAEAKDAYDEYLSKKLKEGYTDEEDIYKLFLQEFPQYEGYIEVEFEPEEGEETTEFVEETIKTESGFTELKYPAEGKNQVDILYIGDPSIYNKYVENDWLTDISTQISNGSGKVLPAYINAAFFDAMKTDGAVYGLSTNKVIGEYTYLLVDKTLYQEYSYNVDELENVSSIADIVDFVKDVGRIEKDIVPFTGELITTNNHFWSMKYDYVLAKDLDDFEEGKIYYVKNEDGTYSHYRKFYSNMEYFEEGEGGHYIVPAEELTSLSLSTSYFVLSPAAYVKAETFNADATYYTTDGYGNFFLQKGLTEFAEGVEYYKLDDSVFVEVNKDNYKAAEGVAYYTKTASGEYKKAGSGANFKFASGTTYYVVKDASQDADMYDPYGAFELDGEYYVANITMTPDEFSIIGSGVKKDAEVSNQIGFNNTLASDSSYAAQLLAIKEIEEKGYYDADALKNPNKKFAAAIVKGNAGDIAEYDSEKYAKIILEYPRVDNSTMKDNVFSIAHATKDADRAMDVLVLLNTDPEFRNLVQYGIAGTNYTLSYTEINGVDYPQIKRLNNSYLMDINTTGNLFIAYPDPDPDFDPDTDDAMPADIWANAKLQNRDSLQEILYGFDLNTTFSVDLAAVNELAAISAEWKAKLDACTTVDELEDVMAEGYKVTSALEAVVNATNKFSEDQSSLIYIYNQWFKENHGK